MDLGTVRAHSGFMETFETLVRAEFAAKNTYLNTASTGLLPARTVTAMRAAVDSVAAGRPADMFADFGELSRERELTDTKTLDWAGKLTPAWLAGTLVYVGSADGKKRELPAWIAATHLFQHAAHHRGQASTLLKQAGHDMGVTDLQYLPGIVRLVD